MMDSAAHLGNMQQGVVALLQPGLKSLTAPDSSVRFACDVRVISCVMTCVIPCVMQGFATGDCNQDAQAIRTFVADGHQVGEPRSADVAAAGGNDQLCGHQKS